MIGAVKGRLEVRILGCGSSGGVPRIGNDWGVCDPAEPRNRRTRCSILIRHWGSGAGEPTLVLVDTSPDMREQLLAANVTRLDAVLITHEHADQCHGIDDLRALVLRAGRRMPVHLDPVTAGVIGSRFAYCFEGAGSYPAILDKHVDLEAGQAVEIGPSRVPWAALALRVSGQRQTIFLARQSAGMVRVSASGVTPDRNALPKPPHHGLPVPKAME